MALMSTSWVIPANLGNAAQERVFCSENGPLRVDCASKEKPRRGGEAARIKALEFEANIRAYAT